MNNLFGQLVGVVSKDTHKPYRDLLAKETPIKAQAKLSYNYEGKRIHIEMPYSEFVEDPKFAAMSAEEYVT